MTFDEFTAAITTAQGKARAAKAAHSMDFAAVVAAINDSSSGEVGQSPCFTAWAAIEVSRDAEIAAIHAAYHQATCGN